MQRGHYSRKVIKNGEVVWSLLERNPGGLTMQDIVELSTVDYDTPLTRAQVRKAFEYIRDVFANQNDQPIVYLPGKNRNIYKLNIDPLDSEEDLRRRLAVWSLQIRRARTAVGLPSMAKFPNWGIRTKRLIRHMQVVEEDLAELASELG